MALLLVASCTSYHFSVTPPEWHSASTATSPAQSLARKDIHIAIVAPFGFPGIYRTVYLVQQAGYQVHVFPSADKLRSAGLQPDLLVILNGQGGHSPPDAIHNINGLLTLLTVGIIPLYSRYAYDTEIVIQARSQPPRTFRAAVGERSFLGWIPWLVGLPFASYSPATGRANSWHVGRKGALDFRDDLARGIIAEVQRLGGPSGP